MKAVIDDLKDSFKIGYEAFYKSRVEAQNVWNLYHNRQYNDDQIATLENRGQPKETFNVIKMFARMLVGADNQKLIPLSAVLGAVFLLFIDTVSRASMSAEIPLSILTGLIGAPFYFYLLVKERLALR